MIFLEFDGVSAFYIARAIDSERRRARAEGAVLPAEVLRIGEVAHARARGVLGGSNRDQLERLLQAESMVQATFTYDETTEVLNVSKSNLKRLIAAGALPVVEIGGAS